MRGQEARGAGLKGKERSLRDTASADNRKADGLLAPMRASWRGAKKRRLLKSSPAQNACLHPSHLSANGTGWGGRRAAARPGCGRACSGGLKFLTSQALMPPRQSARNFAQGVFGWACTAAPRTSIGRSYVFCNAGGAVAPRTPHPSMGEPPPPSPQQICHAREGVEGYV